MPLLMTRVVPDLLYYIEQYIISSVANKSKIPFPPPFSSTYLIDNKSFIRLLFDETWESSLTSYRFLFRRESDTTSIPEMIRRRMMVYPTSSSYYVCDSDSTAICNLNIFNLQDDDITLLDKLLEYRIDSTSADITTIVYDNLTTHLSQLIYIYLNFKINTDYTLFTSLTTPISSSTEVLENFYESFIIDKIFIYLSSLGS
jgi:hypothetical protein